MYNLFSGLDFFKPWKLVEYVKFYQAASYGSGGGGAGSSSNGTAGTAGTAAAGGAGGTGNPGAGGGQGAGGATAGLPASAAQYGGGGGGNNGANARLAGAQGYVLITYTAVTPIGSTGPISLGGNGATGANINIRLGLTATAQISLNDAAVRAIVGATSVTGSQISFNDFRGK